MNISDFPAEGMILTDPTLIRPVACRLIGSYTPSGTGDPRFKEIIIDYGGNGTTCGCLCHWLMWRLGCRVRGLVNRTDHDSGLAYADGKNISMIRNNKYFHLYNPSDPYDAPEMCDIVFISNGPPATEHVFVFGQSAQKEDGSTVWRTMDAGERNDKGQQCAKDMERVWLPNGQLQTVMGPKNVVGWIPIVALPFTAICTLDVAA